MSDEDLIGYLFDLLEPDDRTAVAARVAADPETAARLEHLRSAATPMLSVAEYERECPPEPLPGLAVRTLAAVARHVVENEPRVAEPSAVAAFLRDYPADRAELDFDSGTRAKVPQATPAPPRAHMPVAPPVTDGPEYRGGFRFRADVLIAACIAFVGFGLVMSGVAKARNQSRILACQNNLRTLHAGLTGYADHDPQGYYPKVGTPELPTSEAFATSLVDLGYLPAGYKPGCPAAAECPAYTYTLGFLGPNGECIGLRRPTATSDPADENDLMPVSADLPASSVTTAGGPVSPHANCMNVLFVGGNVRLTQSPNVGPHGDDIYRNVFGQVAAGANRGDAVLGGPGSKPK